MIWHYFSRKRTNVKKHLTKGVGVLEFGFSLPKVPPGILAINCRKAIYGEVICDSYGTLEDYDNGDERSSGDCPEGKRG